jgi:hypothetical protein
MEEKKPSGEWNKACRESLIDALQPSGVILEIGFERGHTAARIQTYRPQSDTIIECDPVVAEEAERWAGQHANVSIIRDMWQNVLPRLGIFDVIVFNDLPLEDPTKMKDRDQESQHAKAILQKGKSLLHEVEEKFPQLASVQYSDREIDEFCQKVDRSQVKELSLFLCELKEKKQISQKQYEDVLQKYRLEKIEPKNQSCDLRKQPDLLFDCLKECVEKHMHPGSRFACLLGSSSRYENAQFFEHIITNPYLDYQEKSIPIKGGPDTVLIMLVEKLG